MTSTKTTSLPFLTTHLANVALNKQIGLVFLLQDPQETCGLTSVSHESLVSDQLHVGAWMIESFMSGGHPDDESDGATPWMEFEPFDIEGSMESLMSFDKKEAERYVKMVEQIDAERDEIGDQLWDSENEHARGFLKKIIAQVHECVTYTAKRVEAIKLCAEMDTSSPDALVRSLSSRGPETGSALLAGFGGLLGAAGIGPLGYITIKNTVTPPMIFSSSFLKVVRRVAEEKAVQKGYTRPVVE